MRIKFVPTFTVRFTKRDDNAWYAQSVLNYLRVSCAHKRKINGSHLTEAGIGKAASLNLVGKWSGGMKLSVPLAAGDKEELGLP
mmetsp:Transcript_18139/g.40278  ORF Transcript_18139/g.40278 Transcript_18139/m.40278 type:complete len:84 (-) Transcript_18139:2-253(-)